MRTSIASLLAFLTACAHSAPGPVNTADAIPPDPAASFVTQRGGDFFLAGERYRFIGVNVYSLASLPDPSRYGCGTRYSDAELDALFAEISGMGATVVRFWVSQSFTELGTDFSRIDRIMALARKHGLKLVAVLENEWSDCTRGGAKDADWYRTGYRRVDDGYRLSFHDYARLVVGRYRNESAILMWQIINEAEARTKDDGSDPAALLAFALDMSSLIKSVDSNHLVSLGTMGGDQPGTEGGFYVQLGALPWIDVIEAHEYEGGSLLPDEIAGNCLETARQLGKSCVIGEIGIPAKDPDEERDRAARMLSEIEGLWQADADGVIIWSYRAGDGVHMDFDAHDPLYDAIRDFAKRIRSPAR